MIKVTISNDYIPFSMGLNETKLYKLYKTFVVLYFKVFPSIPFSECKGHIFSPCDIILNTTKEICINLLWLWFEGIISQQ